MTQIKKLFKTLRDSGELNWKNVEILNSIEREYERLKESKK